MRRPSPAADAAAARGGWHPLTLALLAGLWIAAAPNWPLWRSLLALPELATGRGTLFMLGFGLMIAALTTAMLALFSWRSTIKPAIAVLLVVAALGAHFMGTYGVVIDTTMIVNVVQTDPREVRDLLNPRLLASLLLLAGLPMLVLWRLRLRRVGWWSQAGGVVAGFMVAVLVCGAIGFALFADLSATMRNHRSLRYLINPANSIYALGDLVAKSQARPSGPPAPIGADARIVARVSASKPPLLVLVIGETARADRFSLNGYARPTNPELAARPGVLSFRNVTSCGTSTAASLPCMFSHLGKTAYESRDRDYQNLLDLVQRTGMAVLWLDNQVGCKGLCERVPTEQARNVPAGVAPLPAQWCDGDECFDDALLHGIDARLDALSAEKRARGTLLVMHQMGSHGPAYYKRSPPDRKPFRPECTTNALQSCDPAALQNAYDNSIAYTDHVLAQTVDWLERQASRYDATLLYVSDHGESLGENNLYLHGLPFAIAPTAQTHVPMILWSGGGSQSRVRMSCLRERRDVALTHDNLFHSVLGVLGIEAAEYKPQLDAFAPCRAD